PRRRPGRPCAAARGELAPRAETPRGPYEGGVRCREAGKAATVGHGYPPTGNAAAVGSSDATHGPATTAAAKRARSITSSPATTTTKRTSQRSARRVIVARAPLKASRLVRRCVRVRVDRPSRTRACCGHARARGGGGPPPARTRLDRKSTRLNSSHVKISYAVFCLKKKIRKRRRAAEDTDH